MGRLSRSREKAPRARAPHGRGDLRRGREAHARRAWAEAYESLSRADRATPLGAADLERLVWAATLGGHGEAVLGLLERLYTAHLDEGEPLRAARTAFWIGFRLFALREPGRAGGWMARSQRLVEQAGRECVEEGYLRLPVAQRSLGAGEWEAARESAAGAARIGERFGDRDLVAFARNLEGCALMRSGRVTEGLALIDEAMVAVTSDELTPIITGLTYCIAIAHCQRVYALDRAREWTLALAGWCDAQPQLATFTGACLVHRVEIKQLAGAWPEAIEEARRVSGRPARLADPAEPTADAFYLEAEIHRLRGDLREAEAAYGEASRAGREPQPGLALLRLAQGRRDAASSGIRRGLGAASDPLQRARLLPAAIEILLAAGEVDEARDASRELDAVAARFGTEVLHAMAAQGRGAVLLGDGDAAGALGPLRHAFAGWQQARAPYVAARVRVLLALACRALGDQDGATLELAAAREVFARLGAAPEVFRVDSLSDARPARPHGLTPRELEVLRLVAAGKTNRVIAGQLFLSGKTVDRHVSNIFMKIGVSTRAAATAFAFKNDIV